MTRHRNLARWRFVLPGFLVLGVLAPAPLVLAAPPENNDDFDFDEGDGEGDDGFDFDEGEGEGDGEGETEGEEGGIVIAPTAESPAGEQPNGGPDELDDDWGEEGEISEDDEFFFEDISDDAEALDKELKSGEVQAEGKVGTVTGVVHNAKNEPLAGVYVRAKGTDFVARTEDGGQSWTDLREGLPQEYAWDVVLRHALGNQGDALAFGSTTGNLYVSEDRGDRWTCVANNLPPIYSVQLG